MPKAQSSNPNKDGPSFQAPRQRPRWLMAVLCFVLGLFLLVAFFDYDPMQYAGNRSGAASIIGKEGVAVQPLAVTKENLVGPFGVYSTYWSYTILGGAAWLIPVFLLLQTYLALRAVRRFVNTRAMVMALAIAAGAGILAMQSWVLGNRQWFPAGPGGWIGGLVYRDGLRQVFGPFGAGVLLFVTYALSMVFIFTRDIGTEFDRALQWFQRWRERHAQLKADRAEQKRLLKEQAAKQKVEAQAAAKATAAVLAATPTAVSAPPPPIGPPGKKLNIPKTQDEPLSARPGSRPPIASSESTAKAESGAVPPPEPKPNPLKLPSKTPVSETATDTKPLAVAAAGKIELNIVKPEELKKAKATVPQSDDDNYQFPPLSLLKEQVKPSPENSEEEHRRNAENLLRILSEFGVEVTLGEIHVGPVITRYEISPAAGVRVEKIAGLDKNIALGMRAQSVRILAPIPGKAAVGVEVPNQHPTPVGIREIIESEDWVGTKAELPIALGKDVSGKPLISDLAKMPHLLIAGATGSGKSVCINAIIASILYSKSPKDVRLLMVDPKVVELKVFNSLPHMLIPVVTEPKKVPGALKWLLNEMEQRYQIFAKSNVRNIVGFNHRKKTAEPEPPPPEQQATLAGVDPALDDLEIPDRLPYIVAIIDELADLMMVAPAEIETSIARLAQLARAAGIHLIIATQRPSVNVITGVIKANLPSRIAFQVASQVDSRTILDVKGADTLIGRGDMLFSPPGTSRLVRAQGALVSDDEISGLVEFLKKNGPPVYAQEVQAHIDRAAREDDEEEGAATEEGELGDDEELYQQALEVLKASRRASTSMLQRRLRIGYNRAARIMEIMEEKGIVGPENGSSPRDILVDLDKL
ncbi:MAG TPA: DNA translocase FtsK 4TM domain-containing protein [Opitutaceae bacterium]|nr:DNA translocase FtsK 4TM domain-containing protein [Opitutaceae bacterium]